jgi:hypothetical protein
MKRAPVLPPEMRLSYSSQDFQTVDVPNDSVLRTGESLGSVFDVAEPKCKSPREHQSVRFVEDDNDELILDICDPAASSRTLRAKRLEEITSDLEVCVCSAVTALTFVCYL